MQEYFTSLSNVKIPKLIYGTAWKEGMTADLVELALEKGFRGIDTACQPRHYKEDLVGKGIERAYAKGLKREDLFLQTKFTSPDGQDPESIPYDPTKPLEEQILKSFSVSQKNLHTNYLDSLVLHSPIRNFETTLEAWRTMESLVKEGKVKQIGISNCYNPNFFSELYKNATIKPAVLQNRFYPQTNYDTELRLFCNENNIYYQSFWTHNANRHILGSSVVTDIAKKKGKTVAQTFYRFLNHIKVHPLIGTTSETHMDDDLDLFNFSLSEEECELIKQLGPF